MSRSSRRAFLANAFARLLQHGFESPLPNRRERGSSVLGTGGGPRPRKASSASAQVIVTGDVAYVIDCGDGIARQLAYAGVPFTA